MPINFLTPRVERLRADGAFQAVHEGGALGRFRRPVVLLSRDLCAFALFETGSLPRARRRQAARLHARTASPYLDSGAVLSRAGDDIGVWWWDMDRVGPAVAARYETVRPVLRPETQAQPTGRDWRIVKLEHGYEAQLWRGRALIASAWRLGRFDGAAWAAFTRTRRDAPPAPSEPPPAQSLPLDFDAEAFRFSPGEIGREQGAALAFGAAAATACACAAFVMGQGAQFEADAAEIEAETAEIRAATPRPAAMRALEIDRQTLTAYREIEERTNPLSAAGAAIGITAFHDLTPTAIDVDEDQLTLTLPYVAAQNVDALVAEFEGSGYFHDVRPRTDQVSRTLVFEMKIREAAPPLGADG